MIIFLKESSCISYTGHFIYLITECFLARVYEFKKYVTYDTLVNFFALTKTIAIEDDKN